MSVGRSQAAFSRLVAAVIVVLSGALGSCDSSTGRIALEVTFSPPELVAELDANEVQWVIAWTARISVVATILMVAWWTLH